MTDTTETKSAPSNVGLYLACTAAGIVLGVLATLAFTRGFSATGKDPVVAEYGGKKLRASDAFKNIKTRIFEMEEELYRLKEQAINDFIDQRLLEAESKKQNLPVDQLVEKTTGGVTEEVSEKDVEEFLTSKGIALNDPRIKKDDVKDYLKFRKRFEKRQTFVASLRKGVKLHLNPPEMEKLVFKTEGYPTWGNPKAPVTIIEFSDFQCSYCSRAVATLDRIKKEYGPDKVKIVFRDMPIGGHRRAKPASLAAHCANEQGKFWEYHDMLFQNQAKLEDGDFTQYAKNLSLDEGKFSECYEKKKYEGLVDQSLKEAEASGIQATPTFVINGSLLQGAQPFERFKEKIDRAHRG